MAYTTCEYNLTDLPDEVVGRTKENAGDKTVLKWSGEFPIPSVGDRVQVKINTLGNGVIESYFREYSFVGICVRLDSPPPWHIRQNEGKEWAGCALVFGSEVDALDMAQKV